MQTFNGAWFFSRSKKPAQNKWSLIQNTVQMDFIREALYGNLQRNGAELDACVQSESNGINFIRKWVG